MTARGAVYALVGFSPEIDWRALHFVKPLPPHRICSACGLVRKRTALLPCRHVLCESCYEQSVQDGSHACPLDSSHFESEDIALIDFPADELLRREVKCGNEASGCHYATAASGITQHFLQCEHHTVCCPMCSASVHCGSIIAHLKSQSGKPRTHLTAQCLVQPSLKDGGALFTFLDAALKRQSSEVRSSLGRMALNITAHGAQINEICDSVNILTEMVRKKLVVGTSDSYDCLTKTLMEIVESSDELKECLATASNATFSKTMNSFDDTLKEELSKTRDSLSQFAAAIEQVDCNVKENSEKTVNRIHSIFQHAVLQAAKCDFFVKGVPTLRDEALSSGLVEYYSDSVYLRGYLVSPGVRFKKAGSAVKIEACFKLHKGDMDDVVQWPFENTIKIMVMHPKDGKEHVQEFKPYRRVAANQRPTTPTNEPGYFCAEWLNVNDLITDGYVHTDDLRVKWELLP